MARRRAQSEKQSEHSSPKAMESVDFQAAPRAAQALRLRRKMWTYERIAQACGYKDESGARKAVKTARRRIVDTEARDLIAEQLDMLDEAFQVVMKRIVKDDENSLWAVDRLVPLMKRLAELKGTDAQPSDTPQTNVRREYVRR